MKSHKTIRIRGKFNLYKIKYQAKEAINTTRTDKPKIPEVSMDIFCDIDIISDESPNARNEYIKAAARGMVTK